MTTIIAKSARLPTSMGPELSLPNFSRPVSQASSVGGPWRVGAPFALPLGLKTRVLRTKRSVRSLRASAAVSPVAPAHGVASAAAAAMAKRGPQAHELMGDDILSDACRAAICKLRETDFLSFLPGPIHDALHGHEAMATLFFREFVITATVLIVVIFRDRILRFLNISWSKWVVRDHQVTEEEYRRSMFSNLSGPLAFALASTTVCRLIALLGPYAKIYVRPAMLQQAQGLSLVFAFTWFLLTWKKFLVMTASETSTDKSRLNSIDKLGTLSIYTVALLCTAEITGLALKSIVAIGGVSSFAVGFAAKAVLSNFAGGLMLYITRPFRVGDTIKAGNYSGKVLDIGFYGTNILSPEMVPIFVPNDAFTNQAVTNMSRAELKVLSASFHLLTQNTILIINNITQEVEKMLKAHPRVDLTAGSAYCALKALNHDSLELTISCVLRKMSSENFYKTQQEILVKTAEIVIQSGGLLASVPQPSPLLEAATRN